MNFCRICPHPPKKTSSTSKLIKAKIAQDGSIVADSIKLVGKVRVGGNGDSDDEQAQPEAFEDNSAYCAEGKQVKPIRFQFPRDATEEEILQALASLVFEQAGKEEEEKGE